MTWVAFAMVGRCFAAIALSASIQMTFEIFPTVVRARGMAVAGAAGMTASFLSPFIIHSVSKSAVQIFTIRLVHGCKNFLPALD